MASEIGDAAKRVLDVLAELSPSNEPHAPSSSIPLDWFRWLPLKAVALFGLAVVTPELKGTFPEEMFSVEIDRAFGERLAAVDQLRLSRRSLRAGWLFVAGQVRIPGGGVTQVFTPLVTVPVRVDRLVFKTYLHPVGDVELSPLIGDPAIRSKLEHSIELGGGAFTEVGSSIEVPSRLLGRLHRLEAFALDAAHAAGFDARGVVPVAGGPEAMSHKTLAVVAGAAVYAMQDSGGMSRASTLRSWDADGLERWTAFHSMYVTDWRLPPDGRGPDAVAIESPYPLSRSQRSALRHGRRDPVTVISGPAGNGKSHTVAAIGLDAVARGECVLVTARSDAAVDALIDLFERAPGVSPVVFGSAEKRERLASELAAGRHRETGVARLADATATLDRAVAERDQLRRAIAQLLDAEIMLDDNGGTIAAARAAAPALFDSDVDLATAEAVWARAAADVTGWRGRRKRRDARREVAHRYGLEPTTDATEIEQVFRAARAARAAATTAADSGISVPQWDALAVQEAKVRQLVADWLALDAHAARRYERRSLRAIAALATALRSGRAARREQLKRLDDRELTRALPIWVGTLPDIDDLLPPVPALFDLVILDEASSIEQPLAASALLRARRAVIVGDPRQLRHVSFLSDDQISTAVASLGDDDPELCAMLDVRRNSLFDAAAGTATVVTLDEHFRSAPQLVEFVFDHFYDDTVQIATRNPATQAQRCVDVVRLTGTRDKDAVVKAEVDRVVAKLVEFHGAGYRSVGVVTPFRAQADALEEGVLQAFDANALEQMDLRVGTAHAFQGNERDVMVVSFGIGADDGPRSWRYVEDPHLLAVLLTRARDHMVLFYSADPPAGGLIDQYLTQLQAPRGQPTAVPVHDPWTVRLNDDLLFARAAVFMGYPSGRHVVDLCLGGPERFVGVETSIHSDGVEAHIDRHLELRTAGWALCDAYRSRWGTRPEALVVELMQLCDPKAGAS